MRNYFQRKLECWGKMGNYIMIAYRTTVMRLKLMEDASALKLKIYDKVIES